MACIHSLLSNLGKERLLVWLDFTLFEFALPIVSRYEEKRAIEIIKFGFLVVKGLKMFETILFDFSLRTFTFSKEN